MSLSSTLSALSFALAALLLPFVVELPNRKADNKFNFERWAIVFLAFCVNIIHGVNSASQTWKHNGEVWCDITTLLTVGIMILFACLSLQLSRILLHSLYEHDNQDNAAHRKAFRLAVDVFFFVVIPLVYIGLHFIVQSHRFDIIEDYGCFPSVHDSAFGVLVFYVPLLGASFVALLFAGRCYRIVTRIRLLSRHLRSIYDHSLDHRPTLAFSSARPFIAHLLLSFLVPLFTAVMAMTGFASSTLQPSVSVVEMHRDFGVIAFLPAEDTQEPGYDVVKALRLRHIVSWWCFFGMSLVVLGCSWTRLEALGDLPLIRLAVWTSARFGSTLGYQRRRTKMGKIMTLELSSETGQQRVADKGAACAGSAFQSPRTSQFLSSSQSPLDTRDLRSGWDEMLSKTPGQSKQSTPPKPNHVVMAGYPASTEVEIPAHSPSAPQVRLCPSDQRKSRTSLEDDSQFIADTMGYLLSEPANQIGIGEQKHGKDEYALKAFTGIDKHRTLTNARKHNQTIPDNASVISSICDSVIWPRPPAVAHIPTLDRISDRTVRESVDSKTISAYPIYVPHQSLAAGGHHPH